MKTKIACISLNLDSIGHAIGKSPLKNDPTFDVVFERIENIIDKYDIKMSIFVIGKDLENKENLNYVSEWYKKGHEIGNHTYTHPINFGSLSKERIFQEIKKTDDLSKSQLTGDFLFSKSKEEKKIKKNGKQVNGHKDKDKDSEALV